VETFTPGGSESYNEREGHPILRANQQHSTPASGKSLSNANHLSYTMYIFQRSKQVKQVMIHRLAIYRLKQQVNNQQKHRAVKRNNEEEEHNPSHRKICKEIQLHTVIQDQSNNWRIHTITDPMVGYQKRKPIQKVQTLSSIIKENKNIQRRNTH
jgi:hypothetical protein